MFNLNNRVYDTWYPEWGVGVIKKILKTRIKIKFVNIDHIVTYDKPHYKLLSKTPKNLTKHK